MNYTESGEIITNQMSKCIDVMTKKNHEYGYNEDRLHNFRAAATIRGVSMREALAGMMAKHTISIYDMCNSTTQYPQETWDEKITDHINYLLLLQCLVHEEEEAHIIRENQLETMKQREHTSPDQKDTSEEENGKTKLVKRFIEIHKKREGFERWYQEFPTEDIVLVFKNRRESWNMVQIEEDLSVGVKIDVNSMLQPGPRWNSILETFINKQKEREDYKRYEEIEFNEFVLIFGLPGATEFEEYWTRYDIAKEVGAI